MNLCLELQANTQYYGRRPFGVGLLIAGYDVSSVYINFTKKSSIEDAKM